MRSFAAVLFVISLLSGVRGAAAQEFDANLFEEISLGQTYLLEFSGTVLHENFKHAKAKLTLSKPPPGSLHQYLVLIVGFPQEQTRNSFYWNSEDSTMEVYANHLVCTVDPARAENRSIHFFYLSPAMLVLPFTHKQEEDLQRTLKHVRPAKVFAQAARLELTINAQSVVGTVWMKGYDAVEKSFVNYAVSFSGRREPRVEQTLPKP